MTNRTTDRIDIFAGLTERQRAFVEVYAESNNARQAALEAGYAPSTADNAHRAVLG